MCFDKSRLGKFKNGHFTQFGVMWTDTVIEPKDVASGDKDKSFIQLKVKAKRHIEGQLHSDNISKRGNNQVSEEITQLNGTVKMSIPKKKKPRMIKDCSYEVHMKLEEIEEFEECEVRKFL